MAGSAALEDAARMVRLAKIAAAVGRSAVCRNPGWPTLWLFTDPDRTPDVLAAAARLPRGSGVVFRTFGRTKVEALAPALSRMAHARGLCLLIGADEALAAACGADGVHLPERLAAQLPRLRARRPLWRLTVAAHSGAALSRAAAWGADAAFLSPVLPSVSPSAGSPLGVVRVSALTRKTRLPIYGLGGIDDAGARRLFGSGLAGLAGVGFAQGGART